MVNTMILQETFQADFITTICKAQAKIKQSKWCAKILTLKGRF